MAETALKLRSPNFKSMLVTAPSGGYAAGEMVKVQDTVGLIVEAIDATKTGAMVYNCEKVLVPKVTGSGITFAAGDKVYYDASAKKVTNVASGNTLCGRANEAAGADDNTIEITLNGDVAA